MILFDTNILSELMKKRPNPDVAQWLDDQIATEIFISSVTKAEIELGIALLPDGKRKNALSKAASAMFDAFESRCLAFDCPTSSFYSRIVAERSRSGRPISVEDAQIASIALSNDCLVASRNTRDFKHIAGLRLLNPWQSDSI